MAGPGKDFWQDRFTNRALPWDRGRCNPQLLDWLADGTLARGDAVIVPGCGQGWEIEALAAAGIEVTGIDYAPAALAMCRDLLDRDGLSANLVEADVLHWRPEAPADAVFEQTCLCALYPDHWHEYAERLHAWLRPGGRLLALFMQVPREKAAQGFIEGPPYHCDINAMRALFPATHWRWPKPPYALVEAAVGQGELAVALERI